MDHFRSGSTLELGLGTRGAGCMYMVITGPRMDARGSRRTETRRRSWPRLRAVTAQVLASTVLLGAWSADAGDLVIAYDVSTSMFQGLPEGSDEVAKTEFLANINRAVVELVFKGRVVAAAKTSLPGPGQALYDSLDQNARLTLVCFAGTVYRTQGVFGFEQKTGVTDSALARSLPPMGTWPKDVFTDSLRQSAQFFTWLERFSNRRTGELSCVLVTSQLEDPCVQLRAAMERLADDFGSQTRQWEARPCDCALLASYELRGGVHVITFRFGRPTEPCWFRWLRWLVGALLAMTLGSLVWLIMRGLPRLSRAAWSGAKGGSERR